MDVMASSFRGDPSAMTMRRDVSEPFWEHYRDSYLLTDGAASLFGKPRLWTYSGPVPAAGSIAERDLELDQFFAYMAEYWGQTNFRDASGRHSIRDLICYLGKVRSADHDEHLPTFKEMATLSARMEMEAHLRFNEIRPVCLQFFHVFDENDKNAFNLHTHNIMLWV